MGTSNRAGPSELTQLLIFFDGLKPALKRAFLIPGYRWPMLGLERPRAAAAKCLASKHFVRRLIKVRQEKVDTMQNKIDWRCLLIEERDGHYSQSESN